MLLKLFKRRWICGRALVRDEKSPRARAARARCATKCALSNFCALRRSKCALRKIHCASRIQYYRNYMEIIIEQLNYRTLKYFSFLLCITSASAWRCEDMVEKNTNFRARHYYNKTEDVNKLRELPVRSRIATKAGNIPNITKFRF